MKRVKRCTCILISLLFLSGILQNTGIQGNIIGCRAQEVQAAETLQETSTGWKRTAGERYYYQNGYPVKGFRKIANDSYYFDSKGRMKTGWQYIRNGYRYFDSKTGKMKKNTTVQGRKINADGVWTPIIVLDPGHSSRMPGGYEPLGPGSSEQKAKDNYGAEGCVTKVNEYELNLTIARKLQTELKKQGCKVILTRRNNKTAISCAQRAKIANRAKADVYLRIHANDVDSSSNTGAMTICVSSHNRFVSSKMIRKSYDLSKTILNSYVKATGCRREYVWRTDSMTGNNWSKVPTTLIELGYMSNPSEDRKMQSASYQKKMVKGLSDGIRKYLLF